MDHEATETLKRSYREQLLQQLLLPNNEENVLHFYEGLHLKECSYMLADAWNGVKRDTLKTA
jgi:hypothetical protein